MTTAERFYSELDALKLKTREIPHTLTAEEARACEAVKLQMKGELSTAGKVSVEEVEKIDEAVKSANIGKDAGESIRTNVRGVSLLKTKRDVKLPDIPKGSQWERNVLNSFEGGKSKLVTYEKGVTLYRVGGKNGGFWSLDAPPLTEYQWRVDYAIKQEFCNDASTLYRIVIPEGSTITGLEGIVGSQGMGLYGGSHQIYINYLEIPLDWIEKTPMLWR